jgi:hypothetical protein
MAAPLVDDAHHKVPPAGFDKAFAELFDTAQRGATRSPMCDDDAWNQDFKDPDTGQLLNRELLNQELTKNRDARGHRQPEGLPQRGGQILAAVAGTEQRQEPVLDQL